jgi:hypothetical protein
MFLQLFAVSLIVVIFCIYEVQTTAHACRSTGNRKDDIARPSFKRIKPKEK